MTTGTQALLWGGGGGGERKIKNKQTNNAQQKVGNSALNQSINNKQCRTHHGGLDPSVFKESISWQKGMFMYKPLQLFAFRWNFVDFPLISMTVVFHKRMKCEGNPLDAPFRAKNAVRVD